MHFLLIALLLGSTFWTTASAQTRPAAQGTIATRVQLPGADCALFPATTSLVGVSLYPTPTQRFAPTKAQILSVESSLLATHMHYLIKNPSVAATAYGAKCISQIYKNLAKSRRQYVGFYNEQQQPCLFINCFPQARNDLNWLYQLVEVEDGGANYWRICFNLTTRQFFDFSFNGIA
jgi:hypothetical protein